MAGITNLDKEAADARRQRAKVSRGEQGEGKDDAGDQPAHRHLDAQHVDLLVRQVPPPPLHLAKLHHLRQAAAALRLRRRRRIAFGARGAGRMALLQPGFWRGGVRRLPTLKPAARPRLQTARAAPATSAGSSRQPAPAPQVMSGVRIREPLGKR